MTWGILFPVVCRRGAALLGGVLCLALAMTRSPDPKPLAMVEEADHASIRGGSAVSGTSVYAGDAVKTDDHGTVRLRLGEGKLYLSASSSASLEERAGLATVTLVQGFATFSLPDPTRFELETPVGVLRGSGTKATRGQVRVKDQNEILVSATHGDLVLDSDGEFYTLPQGQSYRISIAPDSPSQAAHRRAHTPQSSQRAKRMLVIIPISPTSVV